MKMSVSAGQESQWSNLNDIPEILCKFVACFESRLHSGILECGEFG